MAVLAAKAKVKIVVDEDWCKGCGLCVAFCPRHAMDLVEHMNDRGFHPARLARPEDCGGCGQCATMCPDSCLRITRAG
jgi:2-oxoglutarate ferredoxin oxidoreductase subunit delta